MNIGDRVRVNITKPETYARGAVECLNGKTGTIEEIKRMGALILVRFDEPIKAWWNGQSPVPSFHFHPNELKGEV